MSFIKKKEKKKNIYKYVMQSSKMSRKSKFLFFYFLAFYIRVLFKLLIGKNPVEIGQFDLKK